ncbi:MAG: aminodeoxychorismate/anthranilate synthase component II [Clostridiales Family XIII bacterium]|nr:aminodeoxychorismate/anthranilate synthase component II [Clostridiales Family XIII bacterium]
MTLIIDNYDSFTYNLYQLAGAIDPDLMVVKNDALDAAGIEAMAPSRLIVSPGPGRPSDAGVCEEAILRLAGRVPVLGICLGHQAICEAFGAEIGYAATLMHGKGCPVHIASGSPIFRGLPPIIDAARYHSLAARRGSLPDELLVIAEDGDGEVMGVKHRDFDVYGLQFHPESILTRDGARIMENFLSIGGGRA